MFAEDWLSARTKVSPNALALIHAAQSWTYAALNRRVGQLCRNLSTHIQPGQHVGVHLPSSFEYICLIHAFARMGLVLVPLNTRLAIRELAWQIDKANCDVVICSGSDKTAFERITKRKWRILALEEVGHDSGVAAQEPEKLFNPANLQAIIFTSGTTGRPKGAMLTFNNHFWSAVASAFRLGVKQSDRWLSCLPLFHVGGLAVVFRSCLYGTAVILHERFDVAAISESLDTQDVTLISLVPTMVHRLLGHRKGRSWPSSLRHLLLGGDSAPAVLLEACHELKIPVSATYGLTEAASQVATALPQETRLYPGACGKPLLFTSVKIVGDSGEELPAGEIGEIVVSGPTVMSGYYNDLEATAKTLRNGNLYTGDVGYLDEFGNLWVRQRRGDIIISGGENIYPVEVEQVLKRHPAILEVCVVGIPDHDWGQRVGALIVTASGSTLNENDIFTFGRQHLAGYKLPRIIKFVDQLPKTASGKISRGDVADSLLELVRQLSRTDNSNLA